MIHCNDVEGASIADPDRDDDADPATVEGDEEATTVAANGNDAVDATIEDEDEIATLRTFAAPTDKDDEVATIDVDADDEEEAAS